MSTLISCNHIAIHGPRNSNRVPHIINWQGKYIDGLVQERHNSSALGLTHQHNILPVKIPVIHLDMALLLHSQSLERMYLLTFSCSISCKMHIMVYRAPCRFTWCNWLHSSRLYCYSMTLAWQDVWLISQYRLKLNQATITFIFISHWLNRTSKTLSMHDISYFKCQY